MPRAGVSFANTIAVRARIESIDAENHTIAFTTNDGRLISCAVGDGVRNLDSVAEGSMANVTYNEVVTLLNLRQKGPGSQEARKEALAARRTRDRVGTVHVHGGRRGSRRQQGSR